MKAVNQIFVHKELGSLLNTREAATNLIEIIAKNKDIETELDFSNVEFMSRSFADQFYKDQKLYNEKTSNTVHIVNANEEIIRILQTVSNTQDRKVRTFFSIPVYKFSDKDLLSDYLLSI